MGAGSFDTGGGRQRVAAADVAAIVPSKAPRADRWRPVRSVKPRHVARRPPPFEPGQYMTIGVFADGKLVQRPYSVASSPRTAAEGYEFYVRLVQGGLFTPLLWRLPVGHGMRMIGPKGKFLLEPEDKRMHL